ncbi:MAG: phosphate ABC transporter permease PstA [Actinomycetota bacterium]
MAILDIPRTSAADLRKKRGSDNAGMVFWILLLASLAAAVAMIGAVLWSVGVDSWSIVGDRLWSFIRNPSSATPELAGVAQGIRGTVILAGIVAATFPLGIGAAIYLEELAEDNRLTRLIQVTVRNLAGVPSIVYGLLGLAVFVQSLGGITGGSSVISAGLTLGVLVFPVVVITAAEAIRAVPQSIRDAAYGLGATQWEVIRHQVVPAAMPGILTGVVLSIARALGEAAPLLVIGAAPFYSTGFNDFLTQLQGAFTALPMNVASFARLPADTWAGHAAAASLVLLVLIFFINLVAIVVRSRISKKLGR